MDKFGLKKTEKFYPYLFEAQSNALTDSKIEDFDVVYTKDGKAIDMKFLRKEMESAKNAIIGQAPLFAPYVHNFTPIYTWLIDTMATDGIRLFVNPAFANNLSWEQKIFVIIHEIMHCVLLHMKRLKQFDARLFNIAGDLEINDLIVDTIDDFDEAFVRELQGLYDIKYLNWNVEAIYEDIKNDPKYNKTKQPNQQNKGSNKGQGGQPKKGQGSGQGQSQPGQGGEPGEGVGGTGDPNYDRDYNQNSQNDPGRTGSIISEEEGREIAKKSGYSDEELGSDAVKTEDKWQVESSKMMERLAQNPKSHGSGKGTALLKTLQKLHKGDVNWVSLLKKYINHALSPEHEYRLGNKKHLGKDYYMYGVKQKRDAIEHVVVMVDVSGSMTQATLEKILNEINQLIFAKKVNKITVAFFDDGVDEKSVQVVTKTNRPFIPKNVSGGGGTSFQKPLNWIKQNLKDNVSLCLFFTDGYAPMPTKPKYANKFIWLIYDNTNWHGPFGNSVVIR